MYFEDQKKQGRNRSFAQVENFSSKNKICQNPTQHQAQPKQIQSTSNKGTSNIQSYTQTHFQQDQQAFSVPSHHQYSSIASSNTLINTKSQTLNHHSSLSLQNNQGALKYSSSQNSQSIQLNNPQSYQQVQHSSSLPQQQNPQKTEAQNILQEQHINTQQNKPQMQGSNSSKTSQLKGSNPSIQNVSNMFSVNSSSQQICGNQYPNNQLYCQEMNQQNNVKKSIQGNTKSKPKLDNDHQENQGINQQQMQQQLVAHSSLHPYTSNSEFIAQQSNTSSNNTQQQLINQQYANKTKKHQRHHSEIAISKHSKQYSILGVNLQPTTQIQFNNYQGFSKEFQNKENLIIYDSSSSSNRSNNIEQNTIQTKPKTVSPHNIDTFKKLDSKNDQIIAQNQNQQTQQLQNEKNFVNSASLRFTTSNPTSCGISINGANFQSNNQKIDQGIQKDGINNYMSLRLKNSRQNSISILPTHDQYKINGIEHNQIDDKINNSSRLQKDSKISTIYEENSSICNNNNNNLRLQNIECLKTKMNPIIQSQKQIDQKLAKQKESDKQQHQQNICSRTELQENNPILKAENTIKNTKFQNYSILADDLILQNLNLQNRRVSALLSNETTQNYLSLAENQSYQSTNRSLNNKHTSISNKHDQQFNYANIPNVSSNNSSIINKSNSSSIHQNNLQQTQHQKDVTINPSFTNVKSGLGSQQNSTSNLSYNHLNNNSNNINNQHQYNQNSILPNSNTNPSFQTKLNNKNDVNNNDINFQLQSNVGLNTKVQNLISHEGKNNLGTQNTSQVQLNKNNNIINQACQGQSQSSHPTYREQEFNIIQDYNPKSIIEKRRKSHSIANNIINSNTHNMKQAVIQSTQQNAQKQEVSAQNNNSHYTNSMLSSNISDNTSQIIIGYNNSNFNQQIANKATPNNQPSHSNMQINNISQIVGNSYSVVTSNQPTPTNITGINYTQNQSNYNSANSNISSNNGYNSGSKQNNSNQQSNLPQTSAYQDIQQDQSKLNVKKVNLTFAEQLKIEKQKKLKEPALNFLNLGINSERNSKQNFVSNTANNSYSVCSNNSNNTSAISTPYGVTNITDGTQKNNITCNNTINSNNKINKNNEPPVSYSGKNSNSSSLQNTYAKNNSEFQQSYSKVYENYTNPNSNRGNLQSTSLHVNQEPSYREMQQINELLQQAKYLAPSSTQNDSKYYTLQYNKLNNFESDFMLPTSAPAQLNNLAFQDTITQKSNDTSQIIKQNSQISNKKNSPDQQNINQLKQTAKPFISNNKILDQDLYLQGLPVNKEQEKPQISQVSTQQLITNKNLSNNNLINQEKINSVENNQQYDCIKNVNQTSKVKTEHISLINDNNNNRNNNMNVKQAQNDKKQQLQNVKQIQQKLLQLQQPVKWYLHDSQAQFEEQNNQSNINCYGLQKKEVKIQEEKYQKEIKVNLMQSIPIVDQYLNSESSSLTQISTYREESSKCIVNPSILNNYNSESGKDIQNQVFNQNAQKQSMKFNKDFTIKDANMNLPYQIGQQVENYKNDIEHFSNLYNINQRKDSYLMDFEDLEKYFSQNNGAKPSNNTPQSEKQNKVQCKIQQDTDEYKDLCSSIESLRLLNVKDNSYIKIQNQEDSSDIQKLNSKKKEYEQLETLIQNELLKKNQEILLEETTEFNRSNIRQDKFYYQQNMLNEDSYSTNQQDFYSQTNLQQKQPSNLKNLNDFESIYKIEEGEYELQDNVYDEQDSQNSSQYSLKAVEEDDKSIRHQQNQENSNSSDKSQDSQEIANQSLGLKLNEGEDEEIEDDQLMCDEDQIDNMMKNEINNDDPNQAFYSNNYYDQPCFNIESYSNYKIIPQSYSNAASNQKQESQPQFQQNPIISPFVDPAQYESKSSNSQNKQVQDPVKSQQNKNEKENQNQIKTDNKQMKDQSKQVQEQKVQKITKEVPQNKSKQAAQTLSKEEKLALLKEELENFDKIQNQFPIFGGDQLGYLLSREMDYQPNPFYMQNQKSFNPTMRAILLDWMMEVSEEFGLKRETYYIAVNIVDRIFSLLHNLQTKEFQLIGVTSLLIASKLEEIYPKRVEQFILSTDNGYTAQLIFETEQTILQQLNFMVNPPTVSFWGNWFMSQWDIFIQTSEIAQNSNLILSVYSKNNSSFVQFRQAHSQSYDLFREYMQVLDFSVLDIQTLQIKATFLHCSIMYLILAKAHGVYSQDYILNQVKQGQIFVKQSQEFNDIYNEFASVSFGVTVFDLVECVSYISQFFALPISNTLPFVIQDMKEPIQGNYEDFLQYQTHNKNQVQIFQKLQKDNEKRRKCNQQ